MVNPFKSPVILSICTGSGGLETGVELVTGKCTVAAYVECEAFAAYNLVKKMETGVLAPAPVWPDVTTFSGLPFRNRIHGITAGYPCTPFSVAGSRSGKDHTQHIWPSIRRIIKRVNPVWCYFENVDDHYTLGFDSVQKSLEDMGYTVEAGIYTAAESFLPHERKRLFILAVQKNFMAYAYQESSWGNACKLAGTEGKIFKGTKARRGQFSGGRYFAPRTKMVASQGYEQYPGEPPRVVESSMGFTVNGYDFRNDLLRLAGNAVVPYQAAEAFSGLMDKLNLTHLMQ